MMDFSLPALALVPIATFAFATSITPGPNNIMLAASGVNFGFARTVPHLLGVSAGFALLAALCALGLGAFILAMPAAHLSLKALGSAYLLYYAWQLRALSLDSRDAAVATPMTFGAAVLFQFVNPKAWVMAVTGAAAFMPTTEPMASAALLLSAVFAGVNFPCITAWVVLGSVLRSLLTEPRHLRLFSGLLVVLTVYSAVAIWL
jgi:threonine/homoserine/homoserine lactone efflux protein